MKRFTKYPNRVTASEEFGSDNVTIHYFPSRYGGGFSGDLWSVGLQRLINLFNEYQAAGSKYALFLRSSNIAQKGFNTCYISDDYDELLSVAEDWLNPEPTTDWAMGKHYFANIVDLTTGEELFYADAWDDGSEPWYAM